MNKVENKFALKPSHRRRLIPIVVAGLIGAVGMTAVAQNEPAANNSDCGRGFAEASNSAMRTHVATMESFYSRANESMQAAVSPGSTSGNTARGILGSCIDTIQNFDLSKLIPDFNLVGRLIDAAAERLVNRALNRVCNAVGNATRTAVGSWNDAVADVNRQFNLDQRVLGAADNYVIGPINSVGRDYGMTGGGLSISGLGTGENICITTVTGSICTDGTSTTTPPTGGRTTASPPPGYGGENVPPPPPPLAEPPRMGSAGSTTLPVRP